MPDVSLVRVLRIRAHHRYWRNDWSQERNVEVFGALSESHPHDYRIEVAVMGEPGPHSGFLVDLAHFDAILAETLSPFRGGDLNESIPEVREGKILPSTEAIASWLWVRLEGKLPDGITLRRVAVWESGELGAEVVESETRRGRGET
jgi:6-pyruvoyltetrahydropterin/6-carboxytetrahydropterin synthase